MPQPQASPQQGQQPQLTPQQQIWADLKQNEPDKAARVEYNGQKDNYGDVEYKRRQQQAQIDQINADAAPNSPFLTNILAQARQQTIDQHNALNTGQPMRANDFNAQWQQNYERLYKPVESTYSANLKSANGRINDYENKLSQYSEEHRPVLSDAQAEKLQSFKQGINTVDIMTNNYQQILKNHPELASNPGALLANLESYANDPAVRAYQQTIPLITSYYAKHIGNESGKLSDFDLKTASGAIPQPGDSPATVMQKAGLLKGLLASDYQSTLSGYQSNWQRTADWQPIDLNNPSTYAPTPRADTGYANPENSFSPGRNPPPDPIQNPTVGQPSTQATPSPQLPDYATRAMNVIDGFLKGNANQQVKTQQQAAAQQQQAAAQQQQAAAQAQQQAAQQAQQQGVAAQQAGAQAAGAPSLNLSSGY
jgi:hypothetical protein